MISIITVCLNSADTIERAISSLLEQTNCNFEHIVVDGVSKDDTVQIVKKYADEYARKNIKLRIVSEPDEGLYDAMNKGIDMAEGEFVGILNADDYYEKDTVDIVTRAVEGNKDIDIVMGACSTVNGEKSSIRYAKEGRFITSRNFNHGAMFVRKACYMEIGKYANDKNYYDDFMWYIKAIKNNKRFLIVNDVLYNFTYGGMSTKKSLKETFRRIKYRYAAYRKNGCSRFYIFECIMMELGRYLLIKS